MLDSKQCQLISGLHRRMALFVVRRCGPKPFPALEAVLTSFEESALLREHVGPLIVEVCLCDSGSLGEKWDYVFSKAWSSLAVGGGAIIKEI